MGLGIEVAALTCFVVAFVNRGHGYGREGVYFNPSLTDTPNTVFDDLDVWDPHLWLGAAIALALSGAIVLALAHRATARGGLVQHDK